LSASVSSVFRWLQTYREKGVGGLKPQPTPGRPPKLTEAQRKRLVQVLLNGPLAAGYRTDIWTLNRVAKVIHDS
jgi:transposase